MAYVIKGAALICAGVLLLLATYSSGNPVPRDPRSIANNSGCRRWLPDINTEVEAVEQLFKGITDIKILTAKSDSLLLYAPVQNPDTIFKLGMEAVCSVHDLYLRFTLALTDVSHTDECNENHIKDISNQYLTAQYVMENACRWVQIQAGGNSTLVKNCTLEDIDQACFHFQRLRFDSELLPGVNDYNKDHLGQNEVNRVGPGLMKGWINCTLEQGQHKLPHAVVTLLRSQSD